MLGSDWLFIGIFVVVAVVLTFIAAIIIPRLIAPRKPNAIKNQTYECGIETVGESWIQFKVQYYIYALIFLIFDVELVFLFPWAVTLGVRPLYAVLEGVVFAGILITGLIYIWRKGALRWE
jgi:NADH:ubiquinone oxidoreductase subunit 3 (subunit A)